MFAAILAIMVMTGMTLTSCSKDDDPTEMSNRDNMTDPEGELAVNGTIFEVENADGTAELIATYIAPNGLYTPEVITVTAVNGTIFKEETLDKKSKFYQLKVGEYTVSAGGQSIGVTVKVKD